MPHYRRGIRVFSEGCRITVRQNHNHPIVEVIDWVIQDGFEAAIVFLPSFIQVVAQAHANVFVLSGHAHIFRAEHFDVLHGDFGNPLGAAMQFLKFRGEAFHIERRDFHGGWGSFGCGRRSFDGRGFGLGRTPFGNFIRDLRFIGYGLFFDVILGLSPLNFCYSLIYNFGFGFGCGGNRKHLSCSLRGRRTAVARM